MRPALSVSALFETRMHNVNLQKREIRIGSRTITLETGKLAKQADGAYRPS